MTHLQSCLLALIQTATPDAPVSIETLRLRIWMRASPRQIKAAVAALREAHHPIGSLRGKPGGYFYCHTPEDAERAFRPMMRQAVAEFMAVQQALPAHMRAELAGQVRLALEGAA